MSQIFEALRRTRGGHRHESGSKRTAEADAVLATLGFASERQRRPRRRLVPLVLLLAVCGVAWLGWRWFERESRPVAQDEQRRPLPTAAPVAPPPATPAVDSHLANGGTLPPVENVRSAPATERIPRKLETAKVSTPERTPDNARNADPFPLALYYHRSGDFENALMHYRAVLRENELNAQAHNNLGLLYQEKGLFDDAVRHFQRALLIDSRYATARNNLGVAWLRLGRLEDASSEFERVLTEDPRHVDALVNLALAQKSGGRAGVAIETLIRAVGEDPSSAPAHYNLAVMYDQSGESGRADDHYRAFLEHAGPEHGAQVAEVRNRMVELASRR